MPYIETIQNLCKENDVELLYASYFGSRLYGTNNEHSDVDIKGIFLPSKRNQLLGIRTDNIQKNSNDTNKRNTSNDSDIELYSIQYFLNMLQGGNTIAVDLLYSFTNKAAVLYKDPRLNMLFENPTNYFDCSNLKAFVGYAHSQAKKYSIKAKHLDIFLSIKNWLDEEQDKIGEMNLQNFVNSLLEKFYEHNVCFLEKDKNQCYLNILGSKHQMAISYDELYARIERQIDRYGNRTAKVLQKTSQEIRELIQYVSKLKGDSLFIDNELPEKFRNLFTVKNSNGFEIVYETKHFRFDVTNAEMLEFFNQAYSDWKALSHAYRMMVEAKELLETKRLEFPLKEAKQIKAIKEGSIDFHIVNENLLALLTEIENSNNTQVGTYDRKIADELILSLYEK